MGKKKRKKNFLEWILNASPKEIDTWIDQSAKGMAKEKSSKELEKLANDILKGKVHIGVCDGIIISEALEKKGINIDIYRKEKMDKCLRCGSKNVVGWKSPAWTWECLAGRGWYKCLDCGARAEIFS